MKRSFLPVALAGSALAAVVFAQPAVAATATFVYTGGEQILTVPAGVTSVHVVAIGGSGGNGTNNGGVGGAGAQVSGDLSVGTGQTLFIEVAGNGQSGASGSRGGFNGGADGGRTGTNGGGGGGGASDVRTSAGSAGLSPDPRLIVAAGGGGGAVGSGSGGGAGGSAESAGASHGNNMGGGAGTASAGGAGGGTDCPSPKGGFSGQLGVGGAGGADLFSGGGGAAGLYGGGGGAGGCDLGGGGGGGGSSLVPPGGTSVLSAQQPQVQISYTQPTTIPDKFAPSIFSFGFDSSRFRAAGKGGSIAKAGVGTRVRYRVSEAGSAKFTVERAAKGRKKGRRCVAPTKRNRKARRCTRFLRLKGSFSRNSTAGVNSFRFTGRLRGKKLRPGPYRLVMVATDAAGNKSKPKRARFRIVLR